MRCVDEAAATRGENVGLAIVGGFRYRRGTCAASHAAHKASSLLRHVPRMMRKEGETDERMFALDSIDQRVEPTRRRDPAGGRRESLGRLIGRGWYLPAGRRPRATPARR
jgi:hypothetical protein